MNKLKKWMQVLLVGILVLALSFALGACSGQTNEDTEPTYVSDDEPVENAPETLPPVQLEMPDYELTYSGEFQDTIQVTEKDGTLVFSVKLSKTEEEIFTLLYNSEDGDYVTVMEDAAGNKVSVAFQMAAIPEKLSEEDHELFCSAQESVNEIVASFVLK